MLKLDIFSKSNQSNVQLQTILKSKLTKINQNTINKLGSFIYNASKLTLSYAIQSNNFLAQNKEALLNSNISLLGLASLLLVDSMIFKKRRKIMVLNIRISFKIVYLGKPLFFIVKLNQFGINRVRNQQKFKVNFQTYCLIK